MNIALYCLNCGLPYAPITWPADISGIGDGAENWMLFCDEDESVCCCEDARQEE